ncbi:MAG: DegV family protein [Acidimicrobiales bacterium]
MSSVVVITDSSTCLPPDRLAHLEVAVVPIMVHLPEGDCADGSDELADRAYAALSQELPVTSSPPSAADYLAAVERTARSGRAPVIVTPAAEFTPMLRNALAAAGLASVPVSVVDSRTAAAGLALVVLRGAEAAAGGAVQATVVEEVERAASEVDLVATLAALGPLRRSGKIPPALGTGAPPPRHTVFRMSQGTVESLGQVEGFEAALDWVAEEWRHAGGSALSETAVFHAAYAAAAASLRDRLGPVAFTSGFSAAMGVHTGPGVVGAAWLP